MFWHSLNPMTVLLLALIVSPRQLAKASQPPQAANSARERGMWARVYTCLCVHVRVCGLLRACNTLRKSQGGEA